MIIHDSGKGYQRKRYHGLYILGTALLSPKTHQIKILDLADFIGENENFEKSALKNEHPNKFGDSSWSLRNSNSEKKVISEARAFR